MRGDWLIAPGPCSGSSVGGSATDGAGGKGTWGRLIDVDTATFLDRNDPSYDNNKIVWCSHGYFVEIVLLSLLGNHLLQLSYCPAAALMVIAKWDPKSATIVEIEMTEI